MKPSLTIDLLPPSHSIELHIGQGLLQSSLLETLCCKYGTQRAILIDRSLRPLYGDQLGQSLAAPLFEIPQGEACKGRPIKESLEDQLIEAGLGRETVLIGFGGGATTDLAGFIASTYLRGVPLILIPTSLLAMVDAAIGGKTGLNTPYGKNLIGTFYHPKAIISDLEILKTLPVNEERNGLAEIVKMGLIFDPEILNVLEPPYPLEELVIKSVKAKIAIMGQDPFERGIRRILNFGHTIAHALEALSQYSLPHGEAVAIGCVVESYLSYQLGYLSFTQFNRIEAIDRTIFGRLQLPRSYTKEKFLDAMRVDKKKAREGNRFVLIDQIGSALSFEGAYCRFVDQEPLEKALNYMEARYA